MPSRIIRESCTTSPKLDRLSNGAERTWWRLVTIADDYGRFEADSRVLLAKCFPLKITSLSIETIEAWRDELATPGPDGDGSLIVLYKVSNRLLGWIPGWKIHQRDRSKDKAPSRPKHPGPEEGELYCSPRVAASSGEPPQVAALSGRREKRSERSETRGGGVGGGVVVTRGEEAGADRGEAERKRAGFSSIRSTIGGALSEIDRRARA